MSIAKIGLLVCSCLLIIIGIVVILLALKKDSTIKSVRESEEIIKYKDTSNGLIDSHLNKIYLAHEKFMKDNNYEFCNDSSTIYRFLNSITTIYLPFEHSYIIQDELRYLIREYGDYSFWEDKEGFKYFKRKSGSISKKKEQENIEKGILSIDVHSNKNRIVGLHFKDIDMSISFDNDTKFIIINNITNYQFNHLFVKLLLNKVNFKYQ